MHNIYNLKNGLRVLTIPMKSTRTATIFTITAAGSKYETRENNGISHFLEHMFFKGTSKRPTALDLSSELDGLGSESNAFTGKEFTAYYIKVDSKKLPAAIEILSDILLNSKFEEEEIEREKGVIVEEINMYHDNPKLYIDDLFEKLLYGDQPAGWEVAGKKENILRFNRKTFTDYLHNQYSTKNTVICLAGDIRKSSIGLVEKLFSPLVHRTSKNKLKVKEKQSTPQIALLHKKTAQAHFSLGVRTFPAGHKDEYALRILSVLLGGSMSSRLFIEVRERRGLAYYIHTDMETYSDSGYLTAMAGVQLDKIKEAIEVVMQEFKRLKEVKISKEELNKVKDLIAGRISLQLESSDDLAAWFAQKYILRNEIVTPELFLKKIKAVEAEDVMRVANKIFQNKNLNLAVIGPYQKKDSFKKVLKF